jgi:hypothetical protein
MKFYSYYPETKEYTGEVEAQLDPVRSKKEGKDIFLQPSFSTHLEPPSCQDDEIIFWNGQGDFSWEIRKRMIRIFHNPIKKTVVSINIFVPDLPFIDIEEKKFIEEFGINYPVKQLVVDGETIRLRTTEETAVVLLNEERLVWLEKTRQFYLDKLLKSEYNPFREEYEKTLENMDKATTTTEFYESVYHVYQGSKKP